MAEWAGWPMLAAAAVLVLLASSLAVGLALLWRRSAGRALALARRSHLLAQALGEAARPAFILTADGAIVANAKLARALRLPVDAPAPWPRFLEALKARHVRLVLPKLPPALKKGLGEDGIALLAPFVREKEPATSLRPHPAGAARSLTITDMLPLAPDRWLFLADPMGEIETTQAVAEDGPELPSESLLSAWPTPAWMRDGEGRLVAVNAVYASMVGAEPEEVIAQQIELVADQLHGDPKSLAMRALATGVAANDRFFTVLRGERRAIEVFEAPLANDRSFGIALDITEFEDLRAEVRQLSRSHAATLDRLTTGVLLFDTRQRLSFFNAAFVRMMRLDEDWLAARPTHGEILDALRERRRIPEQADYHAWKRAELDRHRSPEGSETLWHLPDETSLRVLTEPHPEGGLLVLFEDVTDRLALERSYNTLIAVQRETLDHLHEAVAAFGPDARLKLFNPVYCELWGLDPEFLGSEPHFGEILDRALPTIAARAQTAAERERVIKLKETLLNQVVAHIPLSGRWHRPDGRVLDYAVVPLPDGNVLTIHVDVTDSHRIEQALRERNEALETADRLKSEFVANVSYELRTPLNSIMGFAELLAKGIVGPLSEQQKEYVRHILAAAGDLRRLIDDILDLATIEAGVIELTKELVDVPSLVETVRQMAKDAARKAGIQLTVDTAPKLPKIPGDRRRLVHALYNLVRNGIQFTPEGGRVTIFAKPGARGEVNLGVRDTGIGIPAEERSRVFEKFYRGKGARRRGGAGLGLALVRSFVDLHRGTITVESEAGQGTSVTITLPGQGGDAAGTGAPAGEDSDEASLFPGTTGGS